MAQMKKSIKFGFIPEEDEHHFLVIIPTTSEKNQNVLIYERFKWQKDTKKQNIDLRDKLKADLPKLKWNMISKSLEVEFRNRLKKFNITYGQAKWKSGENPVNRLLGKELLLLVWAIEDCQTSVINTAIKNWKGLDEAERWWLYTMTNASTGAADDRRGWRKAIKYALSENPIEEMQEKQLNFFKI